MPRKVQRHFRKRIGWLLAVCLLISVCMRIALDSTVSKVSVRIGIQINNQDIIWATQQTAEQTRVFQTSDLTTQTSTAEQPILTTKPVTSRQTTLRDPITTAIHLQTFTDMATQSLRVLTEEKLTAGSKSSMINTTYVQTNRKTYGDNFTLIGSYQTKTSQSKTVGAATDLTVEETDDQFMARIDERMRQRRMHLEKTCSKMGINFRNLTYVPWVNTLPKPTPWYFTSVKHKLIYCEVPKSGCSNWKKVLMVLGGLANSTEHIKQGQSHGSKLEFVQFTPNKTLLQAYNDSLKMMVVREPMERLASAYLDKVYKPPEKKSSVFSRFSSEVARNYGNRWKDPTQDMGRGWREIVTCHQEVAELECRQQKHVIKIHSAIFGRQDGSTCMDDVTSETEVRKCSSTRSWFVVSQLCDGKTNCEIVSSSALFPLKGCGTAPNYLQVIYECIDISKMTEVTLCHRNIRELRCPAGELIHIGSSIYGRTNMQICSKNASIYNLQCSAATASSAVLVACNMKKSCVVEATTKWIQSDPCPSTTKYLKIWYYCSGKKSNSSIEPESTKLKRPDPPEIYTAPANHYRNYKLYATFDEYISYIVDPANSDVTKDIIDHGSKIAQSVEVRHWQNFNTLCYPCHVKYDVIAHMETIEEDARYILKMINAPSNVRYPVGYEKSGGSSTKHSTVMELFSNISIAKTNQLIQLYKPDYDLFGYETPKLSANLPP